MKLNELTRLIGTKVVLVPYEAHHVPKYHQWMTDPKLLEYGNFFDYVATASESLSIEEEYDMQKTWRDDDDKLTFIVLDKEIYYGSNKCEISSMVGDVNLFISEGRAEVEIMIAESSARGKGCGTEKICILIEIIF
ncbi:hypothetical protein PFISCL1PPCAC_12366 [Pristionchus fissidentatus]|uniref:N-acetyltransferase domain-containing protein n=1 Tax=Pristionchus fissidentatus TaxID=1538716 RepID=A0AAV5VTI3_9BILA|nr:hypothetical protein PFISCL1PPCAC_12366 [Pristionchus fissidentatus]